MRFDTQWVTLFAVSPRRWRLKVRAKKDSGAARCSIDRCLAEALGLEKVGNVVVKNAMGRQMRSLYDVMIRIGRLSMKVQMSGADRSDLSTPMLIGKEILDILELSPQTA